MFSLFASFTVAVDFVTFSILLFYDVLSLKLPICAQKLAIDFYRYRVLVPSVYVSA